MTRQASRLDSTKVACAAPRESASSPIAPDPANRSSTSASSTGPIRLNAFSRTRSEVGRVSCPLGAAMRCPLCEPAMIRIDEHSVGLVLPRAVLVAELRGEVAGTLDQLAVGTELREPQFAPSRLPRAEQLALPAQVEVDLRELEAVGRPHERVQPLVGRLRQLLDRTGDEQAIALVA